MRLLSRVLKKTWFWKVHRVHAFILNQLHYCNALNVGVSHIITYQTRAHYSELTSLYLLPVCFGIDFKVFVQQNKQIIKWACLTLSPSSFTTIHSIKVTLVYWPIASGWLNVEALGRSCFCSCSTQTSEGVSKAGQFFNQTLKHLYSLATQWESCFALSYCQINWSSCLYWLLLLWLYST